MTCWTDLGAVPHLLDRCDAGGVRTRFAARHPGRVVSLGLISAGGLTSYGGVMDRLRSLGNAAISGRDAVRERLAFAIEDPGIRARNLLTEREPAAIDAPTLVLWTRDDPMATVEDGRRYAGAILGARFELFENSSHMPQFEEPERFDRLHVPFPLSGWNAAARA